MNEQLLQIAAVFLLPDGVESAPIRAAVETGPEDPLLSPDLGHPFFFAKSIDIACVTNYTY